jgi:hypothetical protein
LIALATGLWLKAVVYRSLELVASEPGLSAANGAE